jgi:hypothetical protein
VLQHQSARIHADVTGDRLRVLQDRLPFADRDDLVVGSEREQLAKSPDAAEIERVVAA